MPQKHPATRCTATARMCFALIVGVISVVGVDQVPMWGRFETRMTNTTAYTNKFRDVLLEATFTSPSGRVVPFWGFFDGLGGSGASSFNALNPPSDGFGEFSGTVWKLRFMPDEVGTWTYTWRFDDNSLSGSGSFTCVSSGARPGPLRVNTDNPRWFATASGDDFLPVPTYILPGESLAYPIDRYGPQVYQKYIDQGHNLIVFNWLPIWSWTTQQVNADNAPHDNGILLWYQVKPLPNLTNEAPAADHWDSDRMNLFTWWRMEGHLDYLSERGIYSWGFQGFQIKRSFPIMPHLFDDAKFAWYTRYCMARLASYYHLMWNNTWESGAANARFLDHLRVDGMDPWTHLFMQVGSSDAIYDITAPDTRATGAANLTVTRPFWSTEGNDQWGLPVGTTKWEHSWTHLLKGRLSLHTEQGDNQPTAFANLGRDETAWTASAYRALAAMPFTAMNPRPDLITPADGSDSLLLANPGIAYLAYKLGGGDLTLDLVGGTYTTTWLNAKTLEEQAAGTVSGGGVVSFTASGDFKALRLVNQSAEDNTAPSTPANLQGSPLSDSSVRLSWEAATDPESGINRYRIYQDGAAVSASTTTSLDLGGLSPATTYSFQVAAVNAVGLEGAKSATVSVTTLAANQLPTVILTAPANGSVFASESTITLSASASDPDGSIASVRFEVLQGNLLVHEFVDVNGSDGWSSTMSTALMETLEVQATAVDDQGGSSDSTAHTFNVSAPSGTVQGIAYERFDSPDFTGLPDFDSLTADESGVSPILDVTLGTAGVRSALRFRGDLLIPRAGSLELSVRSTDAFRLILDGSVLGEQTSQVGLRTKGGTRSVSIGRLPIEIQHMNPGDSTRSLELLWRWVGDGGDLLPVPAHYLRLPASGPNADPVISGASANPDPVTGSSTTLSVSASDGDGDSLSYTWIATAKPAGTSPLIGSGQNPAVTFDRAGSYTFQVTVTDGRGGSAQAAVPVAVSQTATGIQVSP